MIPITTEPNCSRIDSEDNSFDIPLFSSAFELLNDDLLASTFHSATSNHVPLLSVLVIAHVVSIVPEVIRCQPSLLEPPGKSIRFD